MKVVGCRTSDDAHTIPAHFTGRRAVTPFEYILPLVSVLVGLAMTNAAGCVHRLLRHRRRVRWDWLPLATASVALLAVLEVWWVLYASRNAGHFTTLGGFLPMAFQLGILFLLSAAALPDEVPEEGIDLRAFYETNASLFWSLYAVYVASVLIVQVVVPSGGEPSASAGQSGGVLNLLPRIVLLALFIVLARTGRRSVHAVSVVALLVLFLAQWSTLRLGAD